jgi:signal transduction histidine kinase
LTSAARFEIIKLMLLDSHPEEAEWLKRHQNFWYLITYLVAIPTYILTFLPIGVPIHRVGINLLFVFVIVFNVLIFKVLPFEKRTGRFRYTIKQKLFLVQIADHYFGSAAVFFTGGMDSSLWYIYISALIMGAMVLPGWAIIAAGTLSIALYLSTVAFLTPYFIGLYEVGLTAKMIVVPMAAFFATILTYIAAKDLNQEISRIRELVNELKKKAFELTGERNKLNTVVGSVADGIFVLNKEKRFSFVNKAAREILKLREEDLFNKRFDDVIKLVDTQTNEQVKGAQVCPQGVVTEDKIVFGPAELRVKVKANKGVWVRLTSSGIAEGPDVDIGCICTFQDVSKEKELEEMKLDFVAMSAHELRTPLTAVRGYLSILMEEMSNKLNTEQQGWVKKAFTSTSNLATLVENLLSISRIEKHNLKLEFFQSDWQEMLQEVANNFKPQADQKEIGIALNVKEKLPKISVDRFRISEVLSNLLANAVTYSKPGSKIEISSQVEGDQVTTSIKDTGEGIPESALPRLFTKFFRVSGALEQGSKGTGLGLYISKAIVEMHKGRIWAESKLGVGSTFSFSLPIRQDRIENKKLATKVHPSA